MAVEMQDVRAALEPEEPDYQAAAALGPDALPHLEVLVHEDDPMLASKAAYAASLLEGNQGQAVITAAAQHSDSAVRVAAAAAARNLPASDASDVLSGLIADADPGVRKVARASVPGDASQALTDQLREGPSSTEVNRRSSLPSIDPSVIDAPMPGERAPGTAGLMPGELSDTGLMPGETRRQGGGGSGGRMPGESS